MTLVQKFFEQSEDDIYGEQYPRGWSAQANRSIRNIINHFMRFFSFTYEDFDGHSMDECVDHLTNGCSYEEAIENIIDCINRFALVTHKEDHPEYAEMLDLVTGSCSWDSESDCDPEPNPMTYERFMDDAKHMPEWEVPEEYL